MIKETVRCIASAPYLIDCKLIGTEKIRLRSMYITFLWWGVGTT